MEKRELSEVSGLYDFRKLTSHKNELQKVSKSSPMQSYYKIKENKEQNNITSDNKSISERQGQIKTVTYFKTNESH